METAHIEYVTIDGRVISDTFAIPQDLIYLAEVTTFLVKAGRTFKHWTTVDGE